MQGKRQSMRMFVQRNQHSVSPEQRNERFIHLITLFTVGIMILGALGFATWFNGTPKTAHAATWTEIFDDEFNGAAGTGADANWQYDLGSSYGCSSCPGNWGTGEVETDTNSTSNVYQDGSGHLVIKALDSGGSWTSGRIETTSTAFGAPVGGELEVTASIQMPDVTGAAAAGYWPAFWMLGSAFRGVYTNWPSVGEIDIMENVNGINGEWGTLHCGVDPGGPCNETTGLSGSTPCSPTTCQAAYHTYTMIVDRSTSPEEVRWYVDGVEFWHVDANNAGMDATTWSNAIDHSFFLILDLAMGGAFPAKEGGGPTSSTASGYSMNVDYIQAYTSPGSTSTTPTPTVSGSTPTATPTTGSTPTATPTASGSGFSQGVNSISSSQGLFWFQPAGWTAGYVILHYTVPGQTQQNVNMTYNASTSRWEYTVSGLSPGQTITYSFTYQENGLQYDAGSYSWTVASSATPTPTPTSTPVSTPTSVGCTGSFSEGVVDSSSTSALPWFDLCSGTAGYVILSYIIPNQVQQNVYMTYDSGTARWEHTVSGLSSGQVLQYEFTYQVNGAQSSTSWYSWTHP